MNNSNKPSWIPFYHHKQHHIYIFLASLNLGGAEKIVSEQLWSNHHSEYPHKVTLILLYNKLSEHSIPSTVNVVRLNNNIINGEFLFKKIQYDNQPLVCHLINDNSLNYLFSLKLNIHLVIHNDKRGWQNNNEIFNHPNIISLIAVCKFVEKQLKEVTNKPILTFRHQINPHNLIFKANLRSFYRKQLNINDDTNFNWNDWTDFSSKKLFFSI